jgi:hypothetical protein
MEKVKPPLILPQEMGGMSPSPQPSPFQGEGVGEGTASDHPLPIGERAG